MLTPKEVAKHIKKSKATVIRYIDQGKISATRDAGGNYQIDPAELARFMSVEPVKMAQDAPNETIQDTRNDTGETYEISVLKAELEAARKLAEERDRELGHRDETIRDLRDRLDREGEERRQLTAMLTDQRTKKRKGLFGRLVDS